MIYKNRFLLQRKFLRNLKNKTDTANKLSFACIDLDNVGKIHGIWGRGAASYVIKIYEKELESLVKAHNYKIFIYARGDEFEILSDIYSAKELSVIIDGFRRNIISKHEKLHYVQVSRKPTHYVYRGNYLKFVQGKKPNAVYDAFNNGKLFFPNFSCGISEGLFILTGGIESAIDILRFFSTIALNEAKNTKGQTVNYQKRIEETSPLSSEFDFAKISPKIKKFKKKLKRDINIDDHHISLSTFDHLMVKNPYSKYKKYLLIEFLWCGNALESLKEKGTELRGGIDGYGLKGMIGLLDPNSLYYLIAQNMDCAVNILNHHKINERTSKMTRFLDRMEVYFNNRLSLENLLQISDEISFSINAKMKAIISGVDVRIFITLRSRSKARKAASFRSYIEYLSKIQDEDVNGWKYYSSKGNIVAVFNPKLLSTIVTFQQKKALSSSQKLLNL